MLRAVRGRERAWPSEVDELGHPAGGPQSTIAADMRCPNCGMILGVKTADRFWYPDRRSSCRRLPQLVCCRRCREFIEVV